MSQRLVRAKRKLAATHVLLRVPPEEQWPQRLDAVATAIYAAFNEGWNDPHESDGRTQRFAVEALWLGKMLTEWSPHELEVLGLLALMRYAHARRTARRNSAGDFVPFEAQAVGVWDAAAIASAEALLRRALPARQIGRFQLEAAIQSAHVTRRLSKRLNWESIVTLYDGLLRLTGSPVVAVNRAVAVGAARGASSGLELACTKRRPKAGPRDRARPS